MRARNIKPAFFKSDALGGCSPLARLLFQGLWCMADHEGRLHYRPRRIKAEVLPYDGVEVGKLVAELLQADPEDPVLRAYGGTADKPAYLWIPKFSEHQSPCRRERAKPSAIPPYPEDGSGSDEPGPDNNATVARPGSDPGSTEDHPGFADVLNTDVLIADSGCTDSGRQAAAEEAAPAPSEFVMQQWNELALAQGLVPCKTLGKKRRQALRARWHDPFWRDHYGDALKRLAAIRWVRGENKRRWRADLDWFLRPDTVTKLVEGGYDDTVQSVGAGRTGDGSPF